MLFRGLCQAICYLFFKKLRQQLKFRDVITHSPQIDVWETVKEEIPYWWRVTTHANLGSASNWLCRVANLFQPIRSTSLIWVVTRHQYGISSLVSQRSFQSFHGETSGDVANCRLSFHRLCLGIVIVFCRLLLRMARIDVDWNLKMLNQIFMFIWCYSALTPNITRPFENRVPGYGPDWIFQLFVFRNYKISLSTLRNRMTMAIKFSRHSGSCARSETLSL